MAGTKKRKKQTAKGMLIKGFLQSFFIVAILLGAAVVGYQATIKLWSVDEQKVPETVMMTPTPEPITRPSVDDISKNLIYCYNKEDNRLSRLVLEVFNCQTKELAYITIPIDTKLTMSDTLYRKLIVVKPEIPQIIKLYSITKYLDRETVFDYGVLMVEELLGTKISYYTVMPEELFADIFEERVVTGGISAAELLPGAEVTTAAVTDAAQEEKAATEGEQEQPELTQVFTEKYLKKISKLNSEAKIQTYLEKLYPKLTSNLPLQDKLNYIESYSKTTMDRVLFLKLAGKELNSGFEMDPLQFALQLQALSEGAVTDSE